MTQYYIVQYNDKYGNGKDKVLEVLVKNKQAFESWLKEHNALRESEDELTESEDEFDLIPINLFES
jgi:hypothetical protein